MARLIEARRLTGRNLLLAGPGAAAEIVVDDADDVDTLVADVRVAVAREGARVGLSSPLVVRRSGRTVSVAVAAPIDALMTATDMLEAAIVSVVGAVVVDGAVVAEDGVEAVEPLTLEQTRAVERNDALVALVDEATARGVPTVFDDEGLTIGLGARGQTWPLPALPTSSSVPWSTLGAVPVALVTGTNGKTTTTRLLASVLRAAGLVVGATSTDGVVIDGVVVDDGDWSGPGGARRVLRDARVTGAVLETARGGLLRRGLALTGYDVAVVTNVADDHLGEFGIDDLDAMAEVKCLVARGLKASGTAILNADDARLRAQAATLPTAVAFFGHDLAAVRAHAVVGQACFGVADVDGTATIARAVGPVGDVEGIVAVAAVPLCFGGAAAFNVDNAVAAAAAASSLGIDDAVIAAGLIAVAASFADSPGRANVVDKDGVTVVIDFAHNPAAMTALWGLVGHFVDAGRAREQQPTVHCVIGAPGDRSDAELVTVADVIADSAARCGVLGTMTVVCRELHDYLRGRALGEVTAVLAGHLRARGVGDIRFADDDVSALQLALSQAVAGDVVVLTPIVDQAGVAAILGV